MRACLVMGLFCAFVMGCECMGSVGPDASTDACTCPEGMICLGCSPRVDGGVDAGLDATVRPACSMPQPTGQMGGTCRAGTSCARSLDCFEELSVTGTGEATTLGIPSCTEDPRNPGEFVPGGDSSIPIRAAPGGQCTQACDTGAAADMCGECATCSTTLGGSPAFPAVGFSIELFDVGDITSNTNPGICRQDCLFDPATTGGCPLGYTCDVSENVCLEACVSDSQCNVGWGVSRSEGLCAFELDGSPYTCSPTTGRCEWTPPADAAIGRPCDGDTDCPSDIGVCLVGAHCSAYQCNRLSEDETTLAYPCPDTHICLSFPGNGTLAASLCIQSCATTADCFSGQSCRSDLLTSGDGICWFNCLDSAQCGAGESCLFGLFADETIGRCFESCDPMDPVLPTGVCAADEACVLDDSAQAGVLGETNHFCFAQDGLCYSNDPCTVGEACFLGVDASGGLADDFYGRCVDGCETSLDCDAGASEECVIFDDLDPITPALTHGVCRAPGEPCSPSPLRADMSVIQPLRGDAQCIASQECSATVPDEVGRCVDRS